MKQKIAIIGAGISGLTAALALEKEGYSTTLYDRNPFVGGRVTSQKVSGYTLDVGFQVLLTAYPLAKKYLNYDTLDLIRFESGSKIVVKGNSYTIGDAFRRSSFLWSTMKAPIGSLSDKWKIFMLSKQVKSKSIQAIFSEPEITTFQYLKKYGFSEKIISNFFKPFFGGIFLESTLETSSRMFEFIFKMFSEGEAAIPKTGIQAIPDQLASQLKSSTIKLSTAITSVIGSTIHFKNGEQAVYDYIIITSHADQLISNLKGNKTIWKGTTTLYFEIPKILNPEKFIHLSANSGWINSISYPEVPSNLEKSLLSVSIIKPYDFSEAILIENVIKELSHDFNIEDVRFLKGYPIPTSLPILNDLKYSIAPSETQLTDTIFLAGDTTLNGSLNAAMLSGELAAKAIQEKITGTIVG